MFAIANVWGQIAVNRTAVQAERTTVRNIEMVAAQQATLQMARNNVVSLQLGQMETIQVYEAQIVEVVQSINAVPTSEIPIIGEWSIAGIQDVPPAPATQTPIAWTSEIIQQGPNVYSVREWVEIPSFHVELRRNPAGNIAVPTSVSTGLTSGGANPGNPIFQIFLAQTTEGNFILNPGQLIEVEMSADGNSFSLPQLNINGNPTLRVGIGFGFQVGGTGSWSSFWDVGIRNLLFTRIAPEHDNDLQLITYFPYTQVPISQLRPSAQARNIGAVAQTNVTLSATLNTVAMGTSTPPIASIAPHMTSPVMTVEPTITITEGPQTMVLTVAGDQANQGTANTTTRTFTVTEDVFATDNVTGTSATGIGVPADASPLTFGNIFEVTQETALSGIRVAFASDWTNNMACTLLVFRMTGETTTETTAMVTIPGTTTTGEWVTFAAPPGIILEPGRYFVAIQQPMGSPSLGVRADAVAGSWFYTRGGDGTLSMLGTLGALGVRMIIYDGEVPVVVSSQTPAAGAINVPVGAEVRVTFNQSVDVVDLSGITINGSSAGLTPSVSGRNLIIAHTGLEGAAVNTVYIPAGAVERLEQSVTWSFTTAFPPADFPDPLGLAVNVVGGDATLTWYHGGTLPAQVARITLTAGDVWGDGSGYQMWLDNTATAYGTVIQQVATTAACTFNTGAFSHRIPENANAVCGVAAANVVFNSSATIDVEPGVFDFMVTNPDNDRIWVASGAMSTQNDFTFEAGYHYTFTAVRAGNNDQVTMTRTAITPMSVATLNSDDDAESFNIYLGPNTDEWVRVANVTEMQYIFTNLETGDFFAGVQAVGPTGLLSNIIPVPFTIAPLAIASKAPAPGSIVADLSTSVVVTFDRNVTAGNLSGITISGLTGVTAELVDGRRLVISHGGFDYETPYTVTIPVGAIVEYDREITWSFTTRPSEFIQWLTRSPYHGQENSPRFTPITITFEENIEEGPLFEQISISPPPPGTPIRSITGAVLSIAGSNLAVNTEYTVRIPVGAILRVYEEIVWSFHTGTPSSIDMRDIATTLVTFYPNPVEDILHIQTTETVRQIEIFNLQGSLVMVVKGNATTIDVSRLPAGTYMIRFTTETGVSTQRFVKR